ncbi:RelA/SpoT domain-containing protein [Methylorubrum sp. SB2]|uniref:RelA/SpoT domain-containing protein n=1 Tax=Methylorubrum subtropicum TaxID=3138812 RepID=UPI00313C0981
MPNFEPFAYSIDDVREASQVIGGDLTWTPETEDRIRRAFTVANHWRDSHAHPMKSMHGSMRAHIRIQELNGFTAARVKRMNAIRGKLRRMSGRRRPLTLGDFQDLGGCRAIMHTMGEAERLIAAIKGRFRHHLWAEDDYIHDARATGYRCHHLKFEYVGRGDTTVFNGRRIELQIRTDLQHSWATAVEAIGMFLGDELKSGKGSAEWLRLLALVSAEFAEAEGCDPAKGMPGRVERIRELKELNAELGAVKVLDNLSTAVFWSQDAVGYDQKPSYYLLRYDNESKQVFVTPHYKSRYAFTSYEAAEKPDNISGLEKSNVVLVEADKMDNLTKAYPNYFGDVQLFKMQLNALVHDEAVSEFKVALQKRAIPTPRERIDPDWMRRQGRGLWTEPKRK